LTRNTGRTPGCSSRWVMAFRSNTLALAPPGHPGLLVRTLEASAWLWGQGCRPGTPPPPRPTGGMGDDPLEGHWAAHTPPPALGAPYLGGTWETVHLPSG
jgi:hypothetical protein